MRVQSGSPGIVSQHGVVTIRGSGEVRMKKVDLPGELIGINLPVCYFRTWIMKELCYLVRPNLL